MPGKTNAPLNKKLRNVKWGEYRLGDLFDIESTLSFNTDMLTTGKEYDYVTRTSLNQGVLQTTGFVNNENINRAGAWSLGLLQMDFFYRTKPWYAGQFVRKIIPKIEIPQNAIPYFTTIFSKLKNILLSVLVRNVDQTFKNTFVRLPVTSENQIDFDFMESFIVDLESEQIAKLSAYLKISGLDSCELSNEEEAILRNFENIEWKEFRIGALFERIKTNKLPYKADDLPNRITGKYTLPCLTSSFRNQGLNYFAPRDGATILKNVISIPSNSDVYRAYFQSNEFTVLSDAYAIRWICSDTKLLPSQYLFIVSCINKVTNLPIYSYKNKLGGWNAVKDKFIQLPVKNDKPDYEIMKTFITTIQKLAIKDVAHYVDNKINSMKKS